MARKRKPANSAKKAHPKLYQQVEALGFGSRVISTRGTRKLSEVIMEFAQPFMDRCDTKQAQSLVLNTAVMAWNMASMHPDKAKSILLEAMPGETVFDKHEKLQIMWPMIAAMVTRKHALYLHDKRFIVNYNIEERGDEFYLEVASTQVPEE